MIPQQKRSKHLARAGRIGVSDHYEFLALRAFALQPAWIAARDVERVSSLGNDPFESHGAGLLHDRIAAAGHVLAEIDARADVALGEHFPEPLFPLKQRRLAQVLSIAEE